VTPFLELLNVSFSYERNSVLEDLNFTMEQGECAALIGPNGVGKTTLLRLAAGIVACSQGSVSLDGRKGVRSVNRSERSWEDDAPAFGGWYRRLLARISFA